MMHRAAARRTLLAALGATAILTTQRIASGATTEATGSRLDDPDKKDIAMRLVCSAENSSLDWRAQYEYIQDIGDGRGYTAGIIGFCSGTSDLLALVELYTVRDADNVLAAYLPALRAVDGTDSHEGLGKPFTAAWKAEAKVPAFRRAQDAERDRVYFDPAVRQAKEDGLGALGQFIYYDAIVFHGPGKAPGSFGGIRAKALRRADSPAEGGSEVAYLGAFLDVRRAAMRERGAGVDTSRVDTAQRVFLREGNLALETPLRWRAYGERYEIP
jgi:chitosanase